MVISYRIISSDGGSEEVLQWLDMQNNSIQTTFFEEFGNQICICKSNVTNKTKQHPRDGVAIGRITKWAEWLEIH